MSKFGIIFDTIIGLVICIIGLILLSTSLQGNFAAFSADISGFLQVLFK